MTRKPIVLALSWSGSRHIPQTSLTQANNACDIFRSPASKSDGTSTRDGSIPEGDLLQLNWSLDQSMLRLTSGELAMLTAMRRRGRYVLNLSVVPQSISSGLEMRAAPSMKARPTRTPVFVGTTTRWSESYGEF